ncbi:MAG: pyridoxal-phosphate dependent enzyme [Ferruginibacter sp.]
MNIKAIDIFNTGKRIKHYVIKTPVKFSMQLQTDHRLNVFYKLENLQASGSFKARGGFNKILKTFKENPKAIFVAPTAGGHGVGLSYAANKLDAKVHILMPKMADNDRVRDINNNGASIQFFDTMEEARMQAKQIEQQKGYIYVSAYNDTEMIEGGGTIATELLSQLPEMDCLVCGVGGGGYLAGMAMLLKTINPEITIIGVQQDATPCIYNWFKKGKYERLPDLPSIAEGIGGMVEEDCITLPYLKKHVDDFLLVTDNQIQETFHWSFLFEKMYVEPSGIVGLTAIRVYPDFFKQFKNIVTVISGANISYKWLSNLQ